MALADFLQDLEQLVATATSVFESATDAEAVEAARVEFSGAKSGQLKTVQKQLGQVDKSDRRAAGMRFNEVKNCIEGLHQAALQRIAETPRNAAADPQPRYDPSLPGKPHRLGHLHPLTQSIEELKDLMGRLGFSVVDGPEIEDERHNFESLNIPGDHPARDPLENFYLSTAQRAAGQTTTAQTATAQSTEDVLLLRSQTSTVQIRVMEKTPPPVRIISLGRVYRPDTADATHYPMFQQMEGLWVDQHVTMADLKTVLRIFATSYLGHDVHIRFRPSFFPFTEPSVEVDMSWGDDWIEFGGAGMVDPYVLESVGYDPEQVTGFAFGLGVERLCMRRHSITDIREFYRNDIRFLHQF